MKKTAISVIASYDDVNNIPQDVMKNIARVQTACSFLEKNSSFFGISIKKSSVTIKDKVNRCTYALRDGANISKTIEEITTKMEKTIDPIERVNLQTQIDNIKNAERFLQERDNIKRTNMLLGFEDTFNNADKTNPYSRAKMNSVEEVKNKSKFCKRSHISFCQPKYYQKITINKNCWEQE